MTTIKKKQQDSFELIQDAALEACTSLSEVDREILWTYLSHHGERGWTNEYSGDKTPNTARVRLHRAMKRIRNHVTHRISEHGLPIEEHEIESSIQSDDLRLIMLDNCQVENVTKVPEDYIVVTIEIKPEDFSEAKAHLFEQVQLYKSFSVNNVKNRPANRLLTPK